MLTSKDSGMHVCLFMNVSLCIWMLYILLFESSSITEVWKLLGLSCSWLTPWFYYPVSLTCCLKQYNFSLCPDIKSIISSRIKLHCEASCLMTWWFSCMVITRGIWLLPEVYKWLLLSTRWSSYCFICYTLVCFMLAKWILVLIFNFFSQSVTFCLRLPSSPILRSKCVWNGIFCLIVQQ